MFADGNYIRSPTGEIFKISTDATFQDGRIESVNEVIIFLSHTEKYEYFYPDISP